MEQTENRYPRTLIVCANALSTQRNNGKMLASFFQQYPDDALAQVYTWPEYPDCSLCDRYFRITDGEMLHSWLGKTPGQVVARKPAQMDAQMPDIFKKSFKNWPVLRLARDVVWSKQSWKTEAFLQWADAFAPEIIFFQGLNNPALYHIAEFLSQRYDAPVIVYITDDYFLPRFSPSPAFHIRRHWLEHSMRHLLHQKHTAMLTVNHYMTETYQTFFGKEGQEIFKAVQPGDTAVKATVLDGPILVSYIGNLFNNRTSTLRAFCKLLNDYPHKDAFRFEIFTRESFSERALQQLTLPPYVTHCGALDARGVSEQLSRSDVLLHMESFGYQNRRDTLLSLSTKLMEYMAAARPILMIGPPEVGSMRFLKESTTNVTVDNLSAEAVYAALDRLLDAEQRVKISAENLTAVKELLHQSNSTYLVREVSQRLLAEKSAEGVL